VPLEIVDVTGDPALSLISGGTAGVTQPLENSR
jgi:hypothetical protein